MPSMPNRAQLSYFVDRFSILVLAISTLLLMIAIGAPLAIFFDGISAFVMIFGTLCVLSWTYNMETVGSTLRLTKFMMWPPRAEQWDATRLENGVEVARGAQRLTMLMGWICALIGVLQIMEFLHPDNEDFAAALGRDVIVTLLPLVYALGMNMLLWVPLERYCALALKRGADVPPFAPVQVGPPAEETPKGRALMFILALVIGTAAATIVLRLLS